MRNWISSERGHQLISWLGSTTLAKLAFRHGAVGSGTPSPSRPESQRLLRGLGEALERIAAREAEEAAARSHASS